MHFITIKLQEKSMEEAKSIEELAQFISSKLVETKQLLSILQNICEGENNEDTLIVILKRNVKEMFDLMENFRKTILNSSFKSKSEIN